MLIIISKHGAYQLSERKPYGAFVLALMLHILFALLLVVDYALLDGLFPKHLLNLSDINTLPNSLDNSKLKNSKNNGHKRHKPKIIRPKNYPSSGGPTRAYVPIYFIDQPLPSTPPAPINTPETTPPIPVTSPEKPLPPSELPTLDALKPSPRQQALQENILLDKEETTTVSETSPLATSTSQGHGGHAINETASKATPLMHKKHRKPTLKIPPSGEPKKLTLTDLTNGFNDLLTKGSLAGITSTAKRPNPHDEDLSKISYIQRFWKHIRTAFDIAMTADFSYLLSTATNNFKCIVIINKIGKMINLEVEQSTGSTALDNALVKMLKDNDSFPPLPDHFKTNTLTLPFQITLIRPY